MIKDVGLSLSLKSRMPLSSHTGLSQRAMQSFRPPESSPSPTVHIQLPIATDVAISFGSLPLVALIAVGHIFADGLTEIGQASEELFRGDRLPSLPLMKAADESR